jgi:MoaA/NifB/PqqE/SkfB family radical SAM enzyme
VSAVAKDMIVPIFNQICIETSALCNRKCVFCPNFSTARPDEQMSWDLIKKMVAELREMKYTGSVANFIYNEPFRDPRALDIIRHFASELPRATIHTSTNCDYFKSKKDIADAFDAGVHTMVCNIYSAADGGSDPKKVARGVEAARKRADQVERWLTELGVDQKSSPYAPRAPRGVRIARVERKYGIAGGTKKLGSFELQNRSGNIEHILGGTTEPLEKMCVRPWRVLNINWTGQAIICCNDYHGATNFGNVAERTLSEIWQHPGFGVYRLMLQNKNRNIAMCDTCDYKGGSYPHMIKRVTLGSEELDNEFVRKTAARHAKTKGK